MSLRHAVELRHDSFRADEAIALCRARNIAIVRACDGKFPDIDAATADFAYLRLMGTADIPLGYSEAALDDRAAMARKIGTERDLYLYVISGEKSRNPAAARALIERLA